MDLGRGIGTAPHAASRITSDVLNVSAAHIRVSKMHHRTQHPGLPSTQRYYKMRVEVGTKLVVHVLEAHPGRRRTLHGMNHKSMAGIQGLL